MTRAYATNAAKDNLNGKVDSAIKSVANAEVTLRDAAENLGRNVRETLDTSVDSVKGYADKVTTSINEKPVQSAAIALVAGLFLGMLFKK